LIFLLHLNFKKISLQILAILQCNNKLLTYISFSILPFLCVDISFDTHRLHISNEAIVILQNILNDKDYEKSTI